MEIVRFLSIALVSNGGDNANSGGTMNRPCGCDVKGRHQASCETRKPNTAPALADMLAQWRVRPTDYGNSLRVVLMPSDGRRKHPINAEV